MLQLARGIALKYFNYSESSIIVKIFTKEFGLQSYIIKGLHAKKSTTGLAHFQPLTLLEFVADQKENKTIHHLKEPRVVFTFQSLHTDVTKRMLLVFIAELLYKSIREEASDKAMFEWIYNALTLLDLCEGEVNNYHLVFMIMLSRFLGFYPKTEVEDNVLFFDLHDGKFSRHQPLNPEFISGELAEQLFGLYRSSFENCNEVKIGTTQRRKLIDVLVSYYQFHLPGFDEMKSIEVLKTIS